MSNILYPIRLGQTTFYPDQQSADNPPFAAALSQQHLQHTTFCLCQNPPTPLSIKRYSRMIGTTRYGLALWPGTATQHRPDCSFRADIQQSASPDHASQPNGPFEVLPDNQIRVHLAQSLAPAANAVFTSVSIPTADHSHHGPPSTPRASETALFHRIWREANLCTYHPGNPSRGWFRVALALCRTTKRFFLSRDNTPLSDCLLVGGIPDHQIASAHNGRVLTRLKTNPSRVFVIAPLRNRPVQTLQKSILLPISGFEILPVIRIESASLASAMQSRRFSAKLSADSSSHVVIMAMIEPVRSNHFKVVSFSLLPTGPQFIPIDSRYEAAFAQYLIDNQRHFDKPIVSSDLMDKPVRPDFILLDTNPPTHVEVWGMQTPEYLAYKQQKIAHYEQSGQPLLQWTAFPPQPFPALPPQS